MDIKTMAVATIGVIVAVVLFSSILLPVIDSADNEKATITNTGASYSLYESGNTHIITFTADSVITDGEAQPLPDMSKYGSATIAYGTEGIFRIHSDGNIRYWGVLSGSGVDRSLGPAADVTITIDEAGKATATSTNESVISRNFTNTVMFANPGGLYALSYNPFVLEDSEIYGCGNTAIGGVTYSMSWAGSAEGVAVSWIYPPDQAIGEIEINTSKVKTNLQAIDSIVIPIEGAEGEATYTYFFAPKEIIYDNPAYAGANGSTILSTIPIFVIVGIILGVVGTFITRRES